jgi:uncharacterized protein YceK
MREINKRGLAFAFAFLMAGCASGFTTVSPKPPQQYSRLGNATGTACGSLGILSLPYYFIPMGLNSRVERAYNNAVASVPEATGLIDVTIQEKWTSWIIATTHCVTISGEAIK